MSKSRRTKALEIPRSVKEQVAERDGFCCILCGRPAPSENPLAYSNAHYISRAHGGLGIEQNILTLCEEDHRAYDGARREELRPIMRRYLSEYYENWTESELIYRK